MTCNRRSQDRQVIGLTVRAITCFVYVVVAMAREQQTPNRNTSGGGRGGASPGDAKSHGKTPAPRKKDGSPKNVHASKTSPNATNARRRMGNKTSGRGNRPTGRGNLKDGSPDSTEERRTLLVKEPLPKRGSTTRPSGRTRSTMASRIAEVAMGVTAKVVATMSGVKPPRSFTLRSGTWT